MDLDQAIWGRRSIREFSQEKVPDSVIEAILDAARMAPTSCNLQVYKLVLVDDPSLLADLALRVTGKIKWTSQLLALVVDPRITWENCANYVSAGMVVQNLMLKAHSLGVATCPIAGFKNKAYLKQRLDVPACLDIPLLIFIGFEDKSKQALVRTPYRRSVDKILSRNRYECDDLFPAEANIERWTERLISEYRSRIMPVYYPRFRHSLWGHVYAPVWERLLEGVENATVLCMFPWEPELFDLARRKRLRLVVADILPDYLSFLLERFQDVVCGVINLNAVPADLPHGDFVVVGGTLQFHRNLDRLFEVAARFLSPSGEMRLAVFRRAGILAFAFRGAAAIGWKRDVYHEAPFYRVGPFGFQSKAMLRQGFLKCGFTLIREETMRTHCLVSRVGGIIGDVIRMVDGLFPETALYRLQMAPAERHTGIQNKDDC